MAIYPKKKLADYRLSEVESVVAHQLKTPLSAAKGYLEVLLSEDLGKLTKGQQEYLKDALSNTNRMIELVKSFLDVSRIEQNRLAFKLEKANLAGIIKETINDFAVLAKAKNCEIILKLDDNLPLVNIDPVKIKQVVANLISNAIEYNKRKGKVEISLKKKGQGLIFCCRDTGIGIAYQEKKKIFTKFYRSEKAVPLTTGGSGLGLFISKAIMEKSGGKIWFQSKKGQGSIFCFSLPIQNHA